MIASDLIARRGLPSADDIERWVIGSVFVADNPNEVFQSFAGLLTTQEFTTRKNVSVFQAMMGLEQHGKAIDRGSVFEFLKTAGELEIVGGLTGLIELDEQMPRVSGATLSGWIGTLREKSALRRIISVSEGAMVRAIAGDSSEAILAATDKALAGIGDTADSVDWRSTAEIFTDYPGGWQHMIDPPPGGGVGLPMPWGHISEELCGMKPGEMILVGARPGMGKSVFGIQCAYHVARNYGPAGVFSMEMSGEAIVKRLIASEGHIDSHVMRHGHLRGEDKGRARAAVVEISDTPLYVDQRAHSTFSMRLAVKRLQRKLQAEGKPPLALLVVDHFHLFSELYPREEAREKYSRSADDIMRMAKEFGVPILVMCQVSRKCEDEQREPQKSDLSETKKLEENAHVIVFLHRPEVYPRYRDREDLRGVAYAIVAKQREGPTNTHNLIFLKQQQRFVEMA